MSIAIPARVAERAATKWFADSNGCHVSTYSTQSSGYAQVCWLGDDGKYHGTTAHCAAWTHHHGPVPDGFDVDHRPTCDKRCVNDGHLRLLTAQENRRRNKRNSTDQQWPFGECVRGHDESHRVRTRKGMICGTCKREQTAESNARIGARR